MLIKETFHVGDVISVKVQKPETLGKNKAYRRWYVKQDYLVVKQYKHHVLCQTFSGYNISLNNVDLYLQGIATPINGMRLITKEELNKDEWI